MRLASVLGYAVLALGLAPQVPYDQAALEFSHEYRLLSAWQHGQKIEALQSQGGRLATMALLLERRRLGDAISAFSSLVDEDPGAIPAALQVLEGHATSFATDEASGNDAALAGVLRRASAALAGQEREIAADALFRLHRIQARLARSSGREWRSRLSRLIAEYEGTAAARSAQIALISAEDAPGVRIARLDDFATRHPGTVEGARALFMVGEALGHNDDERGERDPTGRFFRVLKIAEDLESGAWPDSDWTRRASRLVSGFYASRPKYAAGNIDRMIVAYRDYIARHLSSSDPPPDVIESSLQIMSRALRNLHETKGVPLDRMDVLFDHWAAVSGRPALVRYLQGRVFVDWALNIPAERDSWRARARETFEAAAASGTGVHQRRALARLASLHFTYKDFARAIPAYERYLARYPHAPLAWLAALRLAQAREELDDWSGAAAAYERAADVFADEPIALVLGKAHGARAREGQGQLSAALEGYRGALAGWDDNYRTHGQAYALETSFIRDTFDAGVPIKSAEPVTKASLGSDIARLERALTMPGGALLERGRAGLERAEWTQAEAALDRFLASHPSSPAGDEARYLRHLAQLHRALDLADVESRSPNPEAARQILDRIAQDPWDPAVGLSRMASASLLVAINPDEARAQLRAALEEWRREQTMPPQPRSELEQDVAAIRKVVFRPAGGDPYTRERPWEAFPPQSPRPFIVVQPEVPVALHDGSEIGSAAFAARADVTGLVFMNARHIAMLRTIVEKIGGTRTREPEHVMEVPHQPAGGAREIVTVWSGVFEAHPGHWGGWIFETAPVIDRIEFLDAGRTKAAVKVTLRYEGVTVVLEKVGGAWKVVKLTNRWIT